VAVFERELRALHPAGGSLAGAEQGERMHWANAGSAWLSVCVGEYAVGVSGLLMKLRV